MPVPRGLARPWKSLAEPQPEATYTALLTYFEMQSFARVLAFLRMSARVFRQVASSPGAIGYTMSANPLRRRFWTLSAWESSDAAGPLRQFIRETPHRDAMRAFGKASGADFRSLRWEVKGSDLPLTWRGAAEQVQEAAR
jgi:hypothetical protein